MSAPPPSITDMVEHVASQIVHVFGQPEVAFTDEEQLKVFRYCQRIVQRLADDPEAVEDTRPCNFIDAADFIRAFKAPTFTLAPVLVSGQLASMTAASGAGKTTLASGLVLASVGLIQLPGLEGTPRTGRAALMLGENEVNANAQLQATLKAYGKAPEDLRDRVFVLPQRRSFDLVVEDVRELAKRVGGLDIIMVDSKAAFSNADDENSNTQAAHDAAMLREMTRVRGRPHVLVICHPASGRTGEGLVPRGGSAFLNEIDASLYLEMRDGLGKLAWNKLRQPPFEPVNYRIEPVELDVTDRRGKAVAGVAAKIMAPKDVAIAVDDALRAEDVLLNALALNPRAAVRELLDATGWKSASKITRILALLADEKLIEKVRRRWTLTPKGKREVA